MAIIVCGRSFQALDSNPVTPVPNKHLRLTLPNTLVLAPESDLFTGALKVFAVSIFSITPSRPHSAAAPHSYIPIYDSHPAWH